MRKWRSPEVSADDEWAVNHQIVVPKIYISEILSLAHETPMSGHLRVNKTFHRILNQFYWPGLKTENLTRSYPKLGNNQSLHLTKLLAGS